MSGHSKWASIKHKKAATDARRGRLFSQLIKEITVAARAGGGDADSNPRLRTAVTAAKTASMPADNIKRAIQRGTGEIPGVVVEEVTFEGYGPGGVAVLVEVATDNRNRTVSEIRHIFSKQGGNLGEAGSVAWMFKKRGYIVVPKAKVSEDQLLSIVLDAGGEDLRDDGSQWEVLTVPETFEAVLSALKANQVETALAEISMIPQSYVKLEGKNAQQLMRLLEALEEHDDVQHVYSNFDVEERELEAVSE